MLDLPSSLSLSLSDYHLFRGLHNHLDDLGLTSREEVERELVLYFISKPKDFYKHGRYKLVDRWIEVLGSNGHYIDDSIFL